MNGLTNIIKIIDMHQIDFFKFKINYNALISKFLILRYYEEFKDIDLYKMQKEEDKIDKVKKAFFFIDNFRGERTIY